MIIMLSGICILNLGVMRRERKIAPSICNAFAHGKCLQF